MQKQTSLYINASYGLDNLSQVVQEFIELNPKPNIWLFEGEMGAGKTTFIKELCAQLGVSSNVSSPTYSLVNEYQTTNGGTVYHFDFYRLKTETEALDYGLYDYFDSGNICLCEWPSNIKSFWPEEYLLIEISKIDANFRAIEVTKV
jgi:tRNA threonylcarbamoyladenosine biosynthesis protein TsaE